MRHPVAVPRRKTVQDTSQGFFLLFVADLRPLPGTPDRGRPGGRRVPGQEAWRQHQDSRARL